MSPDRSRLTPESRLAYLPLSLAELEAYGVSRAQVRGPAWRRTSYGFYAPADDGMRNGVRTPLQRIVDAMPLVPAHGALTGWAAAYLAGVTALDGLDSRTLRELPVPICLGGVTGRACCSGVVYLRDRLQPDEVQKTTIKTGAFGCSGVVPVDVRVATATRAAFDGMRQTRRLDEAVAFVDACAHARWLRLEAARGYVDRRQGARHIRLLRQALMMADAASRSPWESRLRVFYMTVAGLSRPDVNVPIFDLDGHLLGIGDLLDKEAGLVTEFDGSHHRDRHQHRDDNEREERFEDSGLTVVRADSLDLTKYSARLVSRLRAGHRRGTQRDRQRDSWTADPPRWWRERFPE